MTFPTDIQLVPLASLAEVNPARSVKDLSPDTEVSFITMGDVSERGQLVSVQTRRYSEVKQGFTAFAEGDVLFAKITPCMENGKGCIAVGLTNSKGFGSTEFHVLRANSKGDPGFIYQWSTSKELRIEAKDSMTGSAGQQRVPSDFFNKFLIPEFTKHEQAKIAEILSTVDWAIEQTEALIAKQERIKTGLMQDLLTRGIDKQGHLRSESTHKFKDSPLGRVPVEWDVETLGQVIGPIVSGWSPTCEAEPSSEGEWAILKTTAVVWSGYAEGENKRLPPNLRGNPTIEVKENDILITRKGPVERVGVVVHVGETRSKLMIPDTVFRVQVLDPSQMIPAFLPLALGCATVQSDWFQKKIGLADAQVNLNHSILRSTLFAKPSPSEQSRILSTIAQCTKRVVCERNHLDKLLHLKSALMQELLTGKKRVTPLMEIELAK